MTRALPCALTITTLSPSTKGASPHSHPSQSFGALEFTYHMLPPGSSAGSVDSIPSVLAYSICTAVILSGTKMQCCSVGNMRQHLLSRCGFDSARSIKLSSGKKGEALPIFTGLRVRYTGLRGSENLGALLPVGEHTGRRAGRPGLAAIPMAGTSICKANVQQQRDRCVRPSRHAAFRHNKTLPASATVPEK